MEFHVLASSSAGNCYQVTSGNLPPILLDAGIPYKDIQIATGFKLGGLAGCLLTHAHGDHAKSVKQLLDAQVDVFASAECWAELGTKHHGARTVVPKDQIKVEGWTVKAFEAVHDSPGTLGYLLSDNAGHTLLYLTDSAYSLYRFDGLTHIAIECNFSRDLLRERADSGDLSTSRFRRTTMGHMSLETLLEMLKANDLSRVQEIHLLHLSDANSDSALFRRRVQEVTGIPTFVAAKRASR